MQYTLPATLTIPIAAIFTAIYNGGKTVVEDVVTNSIKQGTNDSCNCTVQAPPKTLRLNLIGKDIASRLTELNVHEEDQLKVIKMLNNLEWVQMENNCKDGLYNRAMILLGKFFSDFQADTATYIYLIPAYLLMCFAFIMILKHSIVGIVLKIVGNHLKSIFSIIMNGVKSFLLYPVRFLSILSHAYSTSSIREASSNNDGEGNLEEDSEEEFLVCCSSASTDIVPMIDTEEIVARKDQLEEKHGESNENMDRGYESFVNHVQSNQDDDVFPVRKSTPCEKDNDSTRNIQKSEDIEFTLDPNEGYIGGEDESGDESLLCGY